MRISNNADGDELKTRIHQWLAKHYPDVICSGDIPLSPEALSTYYAYCEIAMIEMNLIDQYPEYLRTLRRLKNYTGRLDALTLKKEVFRSKVAFK